MCGRYVFSDPDQDYIEERFNLKNPLSGLQANYNVAPGARMPTISRNSPNAGIIRQWGLVPSWARDPRIGFKLINARAETVTQKPAFARAFHTQRCLIPASGYYEWQGTDGIKKPFFFRLKGERLFSFAGLYDTWQDAEKYLTLNTFTIITTQANKLMRAVHDRMPAILNRQSEDTWLDPTTPVKTLRNLLKPFSSNLMDHWPVGTQVNNSKNNSPDLIAPVK